MVYKRGVGQRHTAAKAMLLHETSHLQQLQLRVYQARDSGTLTAPQTLTLEIEQNLFMTVWFIYLFFNLYILFFPA